MMKSIVKSAVKPVDEGINVDYSLEPGSALEGAATRTDQVRATIFELPIIIVSLSFLYQNAWVSNSPDRSFEMWDLAGIVVASYLFKRIFVTSKWGGM